MTNEVLPIVMSCMETTFITSLIHEYVLSIHYMLDTRYTKWNELNMVFSLKDLQACDKTR